MDVWEEGKPLTENKEIIANTNTGRNWKKKNILVNCVLTGHVCLFVAFLFPFTSLRGLDSLSGKNKSPGSVSLPLDSVILSLQDLIFYFSPPEEELEHEEKQTKLRSLRNRQNLFQEEVFHLSLKSTHGFIKTQFYVKPKISIEDSPDKIKSGTNTGTCTVLIQLIIQPIWKHTPNVHAIVCNLPCFICFCF